MIFFALTALTLSACSSASFFVANVPLAFTDLDRFSDVPYGKEPWQKLDIYAPKSLKSPAPVLVFFYGGRWTFGNKEQYAFAALPFVKKGYIVVVPDYAKYPDVKFPTFVEDGAKSVAWVHDNIVAYNGDIERLYISGHSSGAHIAALINSDPRYLKAEGKNRSIIAAFAGLSGPYDFIPDEEDLKDMFGPADNYKNMQVTTFIDGKQPPMILLHGKEDKTVIMRNLLRLKDRIEKKGGVVEAKIYDGIDHKEIVGTLSWVWQDKAPVANDMDAFFKKYRSTP